METENYRADLLYLLERAGDVGLSEVLISAISLGVRWWWEGL